MQEGIFSILKRSITHKFVPLHQLPDYVRDCMKKARTEWERKASSEYATFNEATTLQNVSNAGCDALIDKCREFLTREGYKLMLDQLVMGAAGYEVQSISLAQAKDLCKAIMRERNRRAASASQFLCLLHEVSHREDTYAFKVTARTGNDNPYDIVLVSDNGSFACTEPYFAQFGMPGRHILACHASKCCAVNVLQHFHPRYLRNVSVPAENSGRRAREINAMQWQEKLTEGMAEPTNFRHARPGYTAPAIARSTSWNWALERVRPRVQDVIVAQHTGYIQQQSRPMEVQPPAPALAGRVAATGRAPRKAAPASGLEDGAASKRRRTSHTFTDPDGSGRVVVQQVLPTKNGPKGKRNKSWLENALKKVRSKKV